MDCTINPKMRFIWKNHELARRLFDRQDSISNEQEREQAKRWLQLSTEEEILLIAERSWRSLAPLLGLALLCLLYSNLPMVAVGSNLSYLLWNGRQRTDPPDSRSISTDTHTSIVVI